VQLDGPKCIELSGWRRDHYDIVHLVNIQSGVGRTFPVLSPRRPGSSRGKGTPSFLSSGPGNRGSPRCSPQGGS